ncbi:MAG: DUF177 domain-containing protein, partial [Ruminococcaceae bacterium]|nr:DUF177 domain-containing protein [Oscillospiraceae bacterium]
LAAVTGECARCLKPVSCELDIHIDELYRSGAAEETSETEDCYRFAGWSVDLLPALRDNLVLAIPLRLYCREDCRGICATCGADLNEKPCGCATAGDKANTPFSKLKELL